jgi:hypothetical protein
VSWRTAAIFSTNADIHVSARRRRPLLFSVGRRRLTHAAVAALIRVDKPAFYRHVQLFFLFSDFAFFFFILSAKKHKTFLSPDFFGCLSGGSKKKKRAPGSELGGASGNFFALLQTKKKISLTLTPQFDRLNEKARVLDATLWK